MSLFEYDTPHEPDAGAGDHRILESFSEQDWQRFLTYVERLKFSPGEYLIRTGQTDRSLFIVVDGTVIVSQHDGSDDVALAEFSKGAVIGEISFFDGAPRSANVKAVSAGEAICISRERFEYLSAWEPDLARTLLLDLGQVLAIRLRQTTSALNLSQEG